MAMSGFILMISMRMDGDCTQQYVQSLDFDSYEDAKFWTIKKGLCA